MQYFIMKQDKTNKNILSIRCTDEQIEKKRHRLFLSI